MESSCINVNAPLKRQVKGLHLKVGENMPGSGVYAGPPS